MVYQGTVQHGVVVLNGGSLPDGTVVRVEPIADREAKDAGANEKNELDPAFRMSELAVDAGVDDLATNADHYLYGHPKLSNGQ
jgi:hypothetical protein